MNKTLSDPVLGTLSRGVELKWTGRVWFTPKHPITVHFDRGSPRGGDVAADLRRASDAYSAIRPREWEYREETARRLGEGLLPNQLRLVRIEVFGDGSALMTYHGPAPFHDKDITPVIGIDGSFGQVHLFAGGGG